MYDNYFLWCQFMKSKISFWLGIQRPWFENGEPLPPTGIQSNNLSEKLRLKVRLKQKYINRLRYNYVNELHKWKMDFCYIIVWVSWKQILRWRCVCIWFNWRRTPGNNPVQDGGKQNSAKGGWAWMQEWQRLSWRHRKPWSCGEEGLQSHHSLVQFSCSVGSLRPHGPQHAGPPCPSPSSGVHSNSCPSSYWCHPTISPSVVSFSSHLQSFPGSRSFHMSQFASGGHSIGVSASTSVLPMNTQDWSPLGWTGWISLQSNGLSGVFSNTIVQKHQFFSLSFLCSSTLTSIYNYWKNHSFH